MTSPKHHLNHFIFTFSAGHNAIVWSIYTGVETSMNSYEYDHPYNFTTFTRITAFARRDVLSFRYFYMFFKKFLIAFLNIKSVKGGLGKLNINMYPAQR